MAIIRHKMIDLIGDADVPSGEEAGNLHLLAKEHMLIFYLPQDATFDPQLCIGEFVFF